MKWKCESCGKQLSGKEEICPECFTKVVYKCVSCGKIMDSGKHRRCPVCNTKRAEKRDNMLKIGCGVVVGAVGVAITIVKLIDDSKNNKS